MDEENHITTDELHIYRQLDQLLEQWAHDLIKPLAQHIPTDHTIYVLSDKDLGYEWWRQLVDRSRFNYTPLSPAFWHPGQQVGNI